jgi:hypothetical protein
MGSSQMEMGKEMTGGGGGLGETEIGAGMKSSKCGNGYTDNKLLHNSAPKVFKNFWFLRW